MAAGFLGFLLVASGGGCGGNLTSNSDAAGGRGATGGRQATVDANGTGGTSGGNLSCHNGAADAAGPVCHATDASVPSAAACPTPGTPDANPTSCTLGVSCQYEGCCEVISCSCLAAPDGGAPTWTCQVLI